MDENDDGDEDTEVRTSERMRVPSRLHDWLTISSTTLRMNTSRVKINHQLNELTRLGFDTIITFKHRLFFNKDLLSGYCLILSRAVTCVSISEEHVQTEARFHQFHQICDDDRASNAITSAVMHRTYLLRICLSRSTDECMGATRAFSP